MIDSKFVKDMRVSFEGSRLTIVTKGGQEFIQNTKLPILAVYPLEDGLIVKCQFNHDLEHYDLQGQVKGMCYLTVVGHPLNDIHILNFS